jgi:hypothetical protein
MVPFFFDGGLSLLVLFRDRKDTFTLDRVEFVCTPKESRVTLDVEKSGKTGGTQDGATHDNESRLVLELTETKPEANGTCVSSGTNNSGDGSSGRRVNVGNNTVTGSLSGLNENGKDNHDTNGSGKISSVGKDQDQTTLDEKEDGMNENTTAHSHASVELVRGEASKTTGEKIHPSKDRGNGGSGLGGLIELFTEVKGGGVVHGQLNTKAASVLDEHNPSVQVQSTITEGSGGRNLWHSSVLLHLGVISLRRIVGDEVDHDAGRERNKSGDDTHSTPREFGNAVFGSVATVKDDLEKREESGSHDKLGNTTTKVTPTSAKSIGSTNDLSGKHTGRPEVGEKHKQSENVNKTGCSYINKMM